MSDIFKASEVVNVAIKIEENGYKFYTEIANESRFFELQETAKFLASEEKAHIEAFKKILEGVSDADITEAYPGEYALYLKALADSHVFIKTVDTAALAKSLKTADKVIDMGIRVEKDSIIFYDGLKSVISKSSVPTVEELISQERNHLIKLLNLKPSISDS